MSEKHIDEILVRLDEMENLQSRLRRLVPQRRNYKSKKISFNVSPETSNINKKVYTSNKDFSREDSTKRSKETFKDQFLNVKNNVMKILIKQWHEKWNKIQHIISPDNEHDVILVNSSVQTSNSQLSEGLKEQWIIGDERSLFSSRKTPSGKKLRQLLERLLEHFNYCLVNETKVVAPDHYLGNNAPRKMQLPFLSPDEEAETLKVLTSAAKVSVDNNSTNLYDDNKWELLVDRMHRLLETSLINGKILFNGES